MISFFFSQLVSLLNRPTFSFIFEPGVIKTSMQMIRALEFSNLNIDGTLLEEYFGQTKKLLLRN